MQDWGDWFVVSGGRRTKGTRVSGVRVLVVEDDASVRGLVQVILEDEGFEVFEAADGQEGLRLAQQLDPAVLVIDVMMPGLGGPEVVARLRRPDGSLPFAVLLLTGAPESVEMLRDELGPDAVMEKPFDIVALAQRVQALAAARHGNLGRTPDPHHATEAGPE
jgi:two-component system, OmpR family, response regulator